MAVVGLGNDIVEIARLGGTNQKRLARRLLAESEWLAWQESHQPTAYLAKRFAAKEAAAKALGVGIAQGITFQDFVIEHDSYGKPILTVTGKAAQIAAERDIVNWLLSISDEKHYACAVVICES